MTRVYGHLGLCCISFRSECSNVLGTQVGERLGIQVGELTGLIISISLMHYSVGLRDPLVSFRIMFIWKELSFIVIREDVEGFS